MSIGKRQIHFADCGIRSSSTRQQPGLMRRRKRRRREEVEEDPDRLVESRRTQSMSIGKRQIHFADCGTVRSSSTRLQLGLTRRSKRKRRIRRRREVISM